MLEFITIFYNILEKYIHLLFKILSLISIKLLNKKEKEFYNNFSQSSTLQWTLDLNIADIPSKDLSRLWKNRRKLPSPLPSWLNLWGIYFCYPPPPSYSFRQLVPISRQNRDGKWQNQVAQLEKIRFLFARNHLQWSEKLATHL